LHAGPVTHGSAAYSTIGELADNRPRSRGDEFTADAQLILDRRLGLSIGGISGIDDSCALARTLTPFLGWRQFRAHRRARDHPDQRELRRRETRSRWCWCRLHGEHLAASVVTQSSKLPA
jgi:hypothetical protein